MRRILSILALFALPAFAKEIRVESFGADKTGSTDSLAAFDAAVDAASAGDTIVVDGGTFSLSAKWVIDKSLTIRGSGTITEATVLAPIIEVTADRVRILDITVDGIENAASWNTVEATIKARAGIFVNAADDVLIQRVRVQDKSTGISLAGSLRTTVRDVLWQGIDLSTTPVNFAFSSGLYVASGFDILIDGGTWTLGGRGIQLAGALTARVNLRGPTVYSTQSNGVYVNGPSGLQWVGGYITTTVGSAVMLQDVDTATISGIYARSTGTTSLELGTGTLLGVNVTDCDLDEVLSGAGTYTDVILSGGRIDELDWDGGATYSGFVVSDCVLDTIEKPIPSGVVLRGNHGDPSEDRVGVGAVDPKVKLDVADDSIRIRNKTTATPPTTGNQGEVVWGDASLSVFTATDTAKTVSYDRVFDVLTYGAIGNGTTDDTAAIQAAIDAAEAAGGTVYFPAGNYRTTVTITCETSIKSDAAAAILYDAASPGVAMQIGTTGANTSEKTFHVPRILNQSKPGTGWNAGDKGLVCYRLYACNVYINRINNFEYGLECHGDTAGFVYNNVYIQGLENNKINLYLNATNSGWCNENNFFGGRFSHYSAEGTNVAGTRHILIGRSGMANMPNGNKFHGGSIETPDVVEYAVYCYGNRNLFLGCRWERTSSNMPVAFDGATADGNVIYHGAHSETVSISQLNGASRNHLYNYNTTRIEGSAAGTVLLLKNSNSSSNGALSVLPTGVDIHSADPATAYQVEVSANTSNYKATGDAEPRLVINHATGRIEWGDGSSAVDIDLYRYAADTLRLDDGLLITGDLTFGATTELRLSASGYMQGKEIADPSAPAAGFGRLYFRDNGAGKTQLVVRFPTGAIQVISTEP